MQTGNGGQRQLLTISELAPSCDEDIPRSHQHNKSATWYLGISTTQSNRRAGCFSQPSPPHGDRDVPIAFLAAPEQTTSNLQRILESSLAMAIYHLVIAISTQLLVLYLGASAEKPIFSTAPATPYNLTPDEPWLLIIPVLAAIIVLAAISFSLAAIHKRLTGQAEQQKETNVHA